MNYSDLIPQFDFIGKEKDIEDHIFENIHEVSKMCLWGEISSVKSQYTIKVNGGRILADIMIWHKDGTGTVIEVKKSKSNRNDILSAISQCLFYGAKMEKSLSNMPRLVIAANVINSDVYEVIKRFSLPINLLMADGDRFVYLT